MNVLSTKFTIDERRELRKNAARSRGSNERMLPALIRARQPSYRELDTAVVELAPEFYLGHIGGLGI